MRRLGVACTIAAFERPYYEGPSWPGGYTSLGHVAHGRYGSRILVLLRSLPMIRRLMRDKDVVYAFGPDILALCRLAGVGLIPQPKYAYEIGDLGPLVRSGFWGRLARAIERAALGRVRSLVLTSEAFWTDYYRMRVRATTALHIIENKIDPETTEPPPPVKDPVGNSIRIGFFGVIRCGRSWQALLRIANASEGRFSVYVRGYPLGIESFHEDVSASENVTYGGTYIYPDELRELYQQVDIVWIAHLMGASSTLRNRANRFYEACYFGKPMVAQKGTLDGNEVEAKGLGVCVDMQDLDATTRVVLSIGVDDLRAWRTNLRAIPARVYSYTDEHERLLEDLRTGAP